MPKAAPRPPLPSIEAAQRKLSELAQGAPDLPAFRRAALAVLETVIAFDAALFHELSPRAPFDSAATKAIDLEALEQGAKSWDENAVAFGRLRELALEQGGVASDREAFARGSRAHKAWEERVARPLRVNTALLAHLTVHEKIIAVVALFRRGRAEFSNADAAVLRALVPALSVADGLHQALANAKLAGPASRLRCVDQRLTQRQRDVVERVALGHTNVEIAAALELSANTVRNLLTDARQRVGAANRAELVRLAVLR